eukprot:gene961-1287_t
MIAFKLGMLYTFTLTARFQGSSQAATVDTVVSLARSLLIAGLTGPMGSAGHGNLVTYDASSSMDPDSPTASLDYRFFCEPAPCFQDLYYKGVHSNLGNERQQQ